MKTKLIKFEDYYDGRTIYLNLDSIESIAGTSKTRPITIRSTTGKEYTVCFDSKYDHEEFMRKLDYEVEVL